MVFGATGNTAQQVSKHVIVVLRLIRPTIESVHETRIREFVDRWLWIARLTESNVRCTAVSLECKIEAVDMMLVDRG